MIKFTNFRTKALALVAMTAFSVGSVFGQAPFFGSGFGCQRDSSGVRRHQSL